MVYKEVKHSFYGGDYMLVNISQKRIDEEKLLKEVQGFEIEHNQNAYIFMNEETLRELVNVCPALMYFQATESYDGMISSYCGRKVYRDENLKFGEVEVR